jgi:hypothetical protein
MLNGLNKGLNNMCGHNSGLGLYEDWIDWTVEAKKEDPVGWSSYSSFRYLYKKIGSVVLISVIINGTSNSTSTTIPVPFQSVEVSFAPCHIIHALNNGLQRTTANITIPNSSYVATVNENINGGSWIASGNKAVIISEWFYFTNE